MQLVLPMKATIPFLVFLAACMPPPQAPQQRTEAQTTTTGATIQPTAKPIETKTVSISGSIVSACHLRFDAYVEPAQDRAPHFDFDEASLGMDDKQLLEKVALCVISGPLAGRSLALVGRADPRGEVEYNFALGARRADNVAKYLELLGVPGKRLQESSRGELDAAGFDEASWARDRRVDILLL